MAGSFALSLTLNTRYLSEAGQYDECMQLVDCGQLACEDKRSLWYAHLAATAGSVESERGHPTLARKYLKPAIEIREKLLEPDDIELAHIWSSYANMLITEGDSPKAPEEAVALYKQSIEIDLKQTDPFTQHCGLFIRYINLGVAKTCMGLYNEGVANIETARSHAVAALGEGSHWDAE